MSTPNILARLPIYLMEEPFLMAGDLIPISQVCRAFHGECERMAEVILRSIPIDPLELEARRIALEAPCTPLSKLQVIFFSLFPGERIESYSREEFLRLKEKRDQAQMKRFIMKVAKKHNSIIRNLHSGWINLSSDALFTIFKTWHASRPRDSNFNKKLVMLGMGYCEKVGEYLTRSFKPVRLSRQKFTGLHYAAQKDSIFYTRLFLQLVPKHFPDAKGKDPMHHAVACLSKNVLSYLIVCKANVNAHSGDSSYLISALRKRSPKIVRILREHGAKKTWSAYRLAQRHGFTGLLPMLRPKESALSRAPTLTFSSQETETPRRKSKRRRRRVIRRFHSVHVQEDVKARSIKRRHSDGVISTSKRVRRSRGSD